MNRRNFLKGMFGSAAAATAAVIIPKTIEPIAVKRQGQINRSIPLGNNNNIVKDGMIYVDRNFGVVRYYPKNTDLYTIDMSNGLATKVCSNK